MSTEDRWALEKKKEFIELLKRFYEVETLEDLVVEQNRHIERLQAKIQKGLKIKAVGRVREG